MTNNNYDYYNSNLNKKPKKVKRSVALLVYLFIALIAIGGAIFYETTKSDVSNNGIYVNKNTITLKEKENYNIKVSEELEGKLTFESSDHATAEVSSDGTINGKKSGKAIIIIRDENNNVLKTFKVRVVKKSSIFKSDSNIDISTNDIEKNDDTNTNTNTNNNTDNSVDNNNNSNNNNNNNSNNSNNNNSNNNNNNNNNNSNNSNNNNNNNNNNNSNNSNNNNNNNNNNNSNNNNNNNNNSNNNNNNNNNNNSNSNNSNDDIILPKEVVVKEIILDKNNITLFLNESTTINALVMPDNADNKNLTWSSSNMAIATVSNGTVMGLKIGKTVITAKSNNGIKKTCNVEVKEKPKVVIEAKSISLNSTNITINVGGNYTLKATFSPSNITNKSISWSSSDNSIATVSNGTVKGIKAGTASITVKTSNGKTATCKVTVKNIDPTGVSLNKTSSTLDVGSTLQLTATVNPNNATIKTVTWSSSDNSIATVSNGAVKGIKAGVATITVKTSNGKAATCKVTVKNVVATGVTLNMTSSNLNVGATLNLVATVNPSNTTDKTVTWSSSDNSIATVSNGTVKGIKAGVATITVKTSNGKAATCKVTVKNVVATGVTLNMTSSNLFEGDSIKLIANVSPNNTTDKTVTWTSSNTGIATVTNGTVKGIKAGSATITARTSNGKTATCKVVVKEVVPTEVTLNNVSKMLKVGETFQLKATVSPSNAKDKSVTWSVNSSSIATVNNGLVKGVSIGTAIVTAKTSNGKTAKTTIVVLAKNPTTYYIGDTLKYWMQEPTSNYAMTHVWVKDPYSQMRTAVSSTYRPRANKKLSSEIINNEISSKNLTGKAMIGIDATSVPKIAIYEGKTIWNQTGDDLDEEEALNYIYGLDSNNKLRYFRLKQHDEDYNKNLLTQILSSGIKYSFSFRPALVGNGKSLSSEYSSLTICNGKNARQALCQIDKNNYLIITNTGTKIVGYPLDERKYGFTCDELKDIFLKNKCQTAVSLDGGGSIVLFYKKHTNNVTFRKNSERTKVDVLYFVEQ